ncbi:MAG: hypothetical protein SXA11_04960 [Cyanobacteriota bacterium]|nr:hypothetical protein [Cyanobacteriota bacterium]
MKPNFDRMTTKELTAYLLSHRDDVEAVSALVSRRTPDDRATIYPAPCTPDGVPIEENIKIMERAIRERIADRENR